MQNPDAERRRATRLPASGWVAISYSDPTAVTVQAELIEASATGFRIAHESKDLVAGLEVEMKRDQTVRKARIVWTHLLEGRRVSGCVLLS